jgi:hypothetical protein
LIFFVLIDVYSYRFLAVNEVSYKMRQEPDGRNFKTSRGEAVAEYAQILLKSQEAKARGKLQGAGKT